jgi:hypothetical protein
MRISNKTPLCLLPVVNKDRTNKPPSYLSINWEDQCGAIPIDAELFLMWIENKDLLTGTCFYYQRTCPGCV